MKALFTLLFSFFCLILSAQHTFSIVAVDTVTGQVAAAGATCLDASDGVPEGARIISALIPGKGAMNAQAQVCLPNVNLEQGVTLIENDSTATAVLNTILSNDLCQFGDTSERQYGIVTLDASSNVDAVGFTGAACLSFAGHRTGITYSVQGNILIGPEVIDSMEARFLNTEGDLPTRVMAAMQGANIPGADSRCLDEGVSSRSSFLWCATLDDDAENPYLSLLVNQTPVGAEPIDSLQTLFDAFYAAPLADVQVTKVQDNNGLCGYFLEDITLNKSASYHANYSFNPMPAMQIGDSVYFEVGVTAEICLNAAVDESGNIFTDCETVTCESVANSIVPIAFQNLKVFPNPAQNALYFSGAEISLVEIYDVQGQLISTHQLTDAAINIEHLATGQYTINVSNVANESWSTSIIKE